MRRFWIQSLHEIGIVDCSVLHLVDKDMVRESISKMKNGKAAEASCSLSKMVKTAEVEADLTTNLANEIIVRVIPI